MSDIETNQEGYPGVAGVELDGPGSDELGWIGDFRENIGEGGGILIINPSHELLYEAVTSPEGQERWGVTITDTGAWAEVNPKGERSRVPPKTFFVRDGEEGGPEGSRVYWADTANFKPFPRDSFRELVADSFNRLESRTVYETRLATVANPDFARAVNTFTDSPTGAAFSQNMFIEPMAGMKDSALANKPPITVIALPHNEDKVRPSDFGFEGLVKDKDGNPVPDDEPTALIVSDPETGIILVRGFAYHGPQKKGPYTLMNLALPEVGVLPLHASATVGPEGDIAAQLGLSGTGKSTIGALIDGRKQIGDDEIGVALGDENGEGGSTDNLEGGVYPIVKGVRADKEPALHAAAFTDRPANENRTVFQNVEVDEEGVVDVDGTKHTDNTRVSVPMDYLPNALEAKRADGVPENITFITRDVGGVLPPIARLTGQQALYWFLMGPTSKTAAQEGDVPEATFSRFFGAPFMSAHPKVYLSQMEELVRRHDPNFWLVNTGHTGGPKPVEGAEDDPGSGTQITIPDTKAMVTAALSGSLGTGEERLDKRFKLWVPTEIPGSESATALLDPKATWAEGLETDEERQAAFARYEQRADAFAKLFIAFFDKNYGEDPSLAALREFSPQPLAS